MKEINDNIHETINIWSHNKVIVNHPETTNIVPSFEWISPDLDENEITITDEIALTYKVSDEEGDPLEISFGYSENSHVLLNP